MRTAALPLVAGTRRGGRRQTGEPGGGHKRPQRGKRPSPPHTSWRGCAMKASAVWRPASLKGEGSDALPEEPAEGWSPAAGVEVAASPELDEPPEPPELEGPRPLAPSPSAEASGGRDEERRTGEEGCRGGAPVPRCPPPSATGPAPSAPSPPMSVRKSWRVSEGVLGVAGRCGLARMGGGLWPGLCTAGDEWGESKQPPTVIVVVKAKNARALTEGGVPSRHLSGGGVKSGHQIHSRFGKKKDRGEYQHTILDA
jgi:hypothetical protein